MALEGEIERLKQENARQHEALVILNDEIMSTLHADWLKQQTISSTKFVDELRGIYDIVQEGLGQPRHFFPEQNRTDEVGDSEF